MTAYILRRLVLLIPVLLVVGLVVFALVHLTPGDPAAVILGDEARPEEIARVREQLGLNDPLYVQFVRWIAGAVRLDLGDSIFLNMPVTRALLQRAEPTGLLTLYAKLISLAIGIPAGVIAASRRNSLLDRGLMVMSVSGAAMPGFYLAILLILAFAVNLRWLPSGGYVPIGDDPVEHLRRMILPAFSLGFAQSALLARLVRSSMLDVLREDYIRTAAAKGIAQRRIIYGHALRNALLPAITVIGTSVGALLGGAVITETVFTLPGMGQLVVQSVLRRDYPVIQGALLLIAVIYVLVNLLVDVLYVYVDPRVRYGNK